MGWMGQQIDTILQVLKHDVVRFSRDGSNSIVGFKDKDGNLVPSVNPEYTFGVDLPAASTSNDGMVARLAVASFGGAHVVRNIMAVSDGVAGVWDPACGQQLLAHGSGSVAAPLATLAPGAGVEGQFNIGGNFSFPANFLKTGRSVRVWARFRKLATATNTSQFYVRLGKNNATNDHYMGSVNATAIDSRDVEVDLTCPITSIGSPGSFVSGTVPLNGQATNQFGDRSVQLDTAVANYIGFYVNPVGADNHALLDFKIWWGR